MPPTASLFEHAMRYHQGGDLAQAEPLYRRVLEAEPAHADALHLLGVLAQQTGQSATAVALIEHAIAVKPTVADFHFNLGIVHKDLGQWTEAIRCYRQAIGLNPNHRDAHINLGTAHFGRGELAEAAGCYQQALRIDPGNGKALCNRAYLRLLQGNFVEGWPDYEYRWAQPGLAAPSFQQPRWDGSPLRGKTIFVYAEQSLGDTIQFVRYLPLVKQRGGNVVFGCQPALFGLLNSVAGADQIVTAGGTLPVFDLHVPLLSLPGLCGTTLLNIPATVPYVVANPKLVEQWRNTVGAGPEVKIGIAWQGRHDHKGDRHRSVPLGLFEKIAQLNSVRLLSLQVGAATEDLAAAPFPITNLGSRFNATSLEDLAAALMTLDLVITVDTGVAHLAGALGVPVWTLLPYIPDWRWLLDRSDSPWYPSMRLFRQREPGDWAEVFERIAREIETITRTKV